MSDPVTNVEIDNVLSSIRKLVSDGAAVSNSTGQEVSDEARARFVLTPSLRVNDQPASDENADAAVSEAALDPADDALVEDTVNFVAPGPLLLTPETQMEAPLVHDQMSDHDRATLETKIAELEEAVGAQAQQDWEPDGSEIEATDNLARVFEEDTNTPSSPEGADEPALTEDRAFEALAAAQEANIPIFGHVEPAGDSDEDEKTVETETGSSGQAARTIPLDDPTIDHGDELQGDDVGLPIPDNLDETIAAYIAGGTGIQEAELRQMIVDVVREELRGELGERITRNVRKMVRREVQRALQTQGVN